MAERSSSRHQWLPGSFVLVVAFCAGLVSACGSTDGSEDATVKLNFANLSDTGRTGRLVDPSTLASSAAPSAFSMKLIAAYLTEDMDEETQNNVGSTAIFYLNEECEEDIMHCDIEGGTAEDGTSMSHVITTFFDLGSPETVNAQLNSQGRGVEAGTYRYARLEFCKYADGDNPNINWDYGSVGEQSFRRTICSVNSAEMDPPLELAAGDAATITLSYDLSSAVQVGADATGDDCTGLGDGLTCFTIPAFTPSATKD